MFDKYFVETVKIVADSDLGYAVINKSDYDKKAHKLYVEPVQTPNPPAE